MAYDSIYVKQLEETIDQLRDHNNVLEKHYAEFYRDTTAMMGKDAKRIAELEAEVARLRKAHAAMLDLINSSQGVYGLHLNGDGAPWDSLRTGGQFEAWLLDFDAALEASD